MKDKSVVPYIASRTIVEPELLGVMVQTDLDALQPNTSFMFANEFKAPDSISLAVKPEKFCMTCFMNSLLSKDIPVFDAKMQSPWATHCIWHQSSLLPVKLLESQAAYNFNWAQFDDSSQYRFWCNRVEEARLSLTKRGLGRSEITVSPPSRAIVAINQLFYDATQANLGASTLGLQENPEFIRQMFYAVFYMLSRRYQGWSLGREMTRSRTREGYFPTTDSFSPELLNILTPEQKHRCVEYIAQFISNSETIHPYLLTDEIRSARLAFQRRNNTACPEMRNDSMMCLAWIIHEHFGKGFLAKIDKLFPEYGSRWTEIYEKISVESHP